MGISLESLRKDFLGKYGIYAIGEEGEENFLILTTDLEETNRNLPIDSRIIVRKERSKLN